MPQLDIVRPPRPARRFDLSVVVLLAANALPLLGVLFWGWDAARIVFLYWFENVVVGAINVLKIIGARGPAKPSSGEAADLMSAESEADLSKLQGFSNAFLVPFFIVHYGLFTLVHGIFLVAFFSSGGVLSGGTSTHFSGAGELFGRVFSDGGGWAALALIASHLYSFGSNYIAGGEYLRKNASQVMMAPYGRIVVLHLAILFGGMAVQLLENPVPLLVLLVIGKTALDLGLHWRSHKVDPASS